MIVFCALALLAWIISLVTTIVDLRSVEELLPQPVDPSVPAPLVAAIVPARNEAPRIEACLRSLCASTWPALRIICVDDRSEDETFAIAASIGDERLTVVRGEPLAPGWLGKNFANHQGVAHAGEAELLLFTDADTVHAPEALATTMGAARTRSIDLLTLLTDLRCVGFWERAILPQVISTIIGLYPMRMVNDPRSKVAIANGQFILIRRAVYEAIGGHAAIRACVADDLELAKLTKGRGFRLWGAGGRRLVSVRMYESLRDIWWGFAKNASAGAGGVWLALAGTAVVLFTVAPFFLWPFLHGPARWLALLACLAALSQRALLYWKAFLLPLRWVLTLPFALLILVGITAHSALRHITGAGPRWKGRDYPRAR